MIECKTKKMAIAILETFAETLPSETQREALAAVKSWVKLKIPDLPETPEEREKMANEIKESLRRCMSEEERRKEASFFLQGLT